MTGRCESCYCAIPDDDRRCAGCRDVFAHAVASAIIYGVTYFGALALVAVGSYATGVVVASVGGFAFWRARRRMREIRIETSGHALPRASIVR